MNRKRRNSLMVSLLWMATAVVASIRVPKGDGQTALTLTADVDETVVLQGVHPIFLRFHAAQDSNDGSDQLFTLDWFRFE